jgi:hypothetical protein
MAKHKVVVHCEYEVELEIEAVDEEMAEYQAEMIVAEQYIVFSREVEEHFPFESITAYIPKKK